MTNKLNKIICATTIVALGFNVLGDTIYDTYSSYNGTAFSPLINGQELGNEISIPGNSYILTNFSIAYYAPDVLSPTIGIDVRFYLNDGAPVNGYNSPGTLLFDSGYYFGLLSGPLNSTNSVTYTSSDFYGGSLLNLPANYLMPSDFTFTVTFTNTAGPGFGLDGLQLPLANSSTAGPGASHGDYWIVNGGNWELLTNALPANLIVNFSGVPEPSVFYLGAVGSALLLGVNKFRRKA